MTHTIYKYRHMQEKMFNEGYEAAELKMSADAAALKYFGNELVAKIQRHDGTFIYQMKTEVVEEILRYIAILSEAAETVYAWENLKTGIPASLTKKEKALVYFVSSLKPDEKIMESLLGCYKGSPYMSFYRNPQTVEETNAEKAEKSRISDFFSW
ncbi:MAG: hypothetical protein IJ447_00020 [Clostridia bacterium]|nr:hypothetical protein [Clostridia bacterium]